MENLAQVQGGNDYGDAASTSSAHAQSDQNKMAKFCARGEEILETFTHSIRAFECQTTKIKSLADSVASLEKALGQKRQMETPMAGSSSKRSRNEGASESENDEGAGPEDELADLMNGTDSHKEPELEGEFLQDLSDFFSEEEETGEPISDRVARLVDKSVRGQANDDNMKILKDKYKRPANVINLQVPRVDRLLWEQLKNQTKMSDAIRQKAVQRQMEGIMPMMMAMEHLANTKSVDMGLLKTYIGDTFKIMCHNIIKTNTERRETIKKELSPKYKVVCDSPVSATGLFGDSLAEEVKKLDQRQVTMTSKAPFLGKSGTAGATNQFQRTQTHRRPQHHYSGSHKPKSQIQSGQFKGPYNSFRSGKHSDKSVMGKKKWER